MTSISDTEVVNAPGGLVELAYKDDVFTNSITATTAATAQTLMGAVTVVCDGSPIELEVFLAGARPDTAAGNRQLYLTLLINGSRVLDQFGLVITPSAGDVYRPTTIRRRMTPTAGVHTYEVRAYVDAGTGFIESGSSSGGTLRPRSYIKVNKILQASQLLVTQSNAPLVTQLPVGNLVDGQRVDLYANNVVYPERWNSSTSAWNVVGAPNIQQGVSNTSQTYSTASTWQNTNLSVSITPSSTTSRIMLNMSAFLSVSAAGVLGEWRIIRNGTTVVSPNRTGPATGQTINGLIADYNTNRLLNGIPFVTLDSPASTSAQTYTLQVYPNGSISVYLNRWGLDANWGATSSIIAQEIPA